MNPYTTAYFDSISPGSDRSAQVIVPMVLDLVRPRSVVDVGCGAGAWLAEFARAGGSRLQRLVGLDGDYVDRARLEIESSSFRAVDLGRPIPTRLREELGEGTFDLAVSLEVAEHLPPERSEGFVADLCSLGEVVLFSAAIPYQGGEGHINERWPTFWYELFKARGYELIDAIRKRVWSDRRVEPWYQQNVLIYATPAAIQARPKLAREYAETCPGFLSMVHPRLYGPLVERAGLKPPGPWAPAGLVGAAEPKPAAAMRAIA
ncbi:MAG: class I SAM-dependent methyltransferase [Phycisphaerales bacterium]|nr:class I SAM-dependent methyltransferase [Phycisphaerales bacterium]